MHAELLQAVRPCPSAWDATWQHGKACACHSRITAMPHSAPAPTPRVRSMLVGFWVACSASARFVLLIGVDV